MTKVNLLDAKYWETRYIEHRTSWDIGYPNKVLTDFVENNLPKTAKILVPGAGKAYEVDHLWNLGYKNVYALDFSKTAKSIFTDRVLDFPEEQFITEDFFKLNEKFDAIIEQTFFCALSPNLRKRYVDQTFKILNPRGILFGLMFNFDKPEGPPFGGSIEEYQSLFETKYSIKRMEACAESIPQRLGTELIVELIKK